MFVAVDMLQNRRVSGTVAGRDVRQESAAKIKDGAKKEREKLSARWGCGLFVGVEVKSSELIIVDHNTKMLKHARTVRRAPGTQRWDLVNLAWVEMVPWNRGTK